MEQNQLARERIAAYLNVLLTSALPYVCDSDLTPYEKELGLQKILAEQRGIFMAVGYYDVNFAVEFFEKNRSYLDNLHTELDRLIKNRKT